MPITSEQVEKIRRESIIDKMNEPTNPLRINHDFHEVSGGRQFVCAIIGPIWRSTIYQGKVTLQPDSLMIEDIIRLLKNNGAQPFDCLSDCCHNQSPCFVAPKQAHGNSIQINEAALILLLEMGVNKMHQYEATCSALGIDPLAQKSLPQSPKTEGHAMKVTFNRRNQQENRLG